MTRFLPAKALGSAALCAAALAFAAPAQAAVIATLTFDTPTGTVFSNESVPVYLTLHLDAASDAIKTDASGTVTSGLTDQDIIDKGIDPMAVVRTNVNNFYECSGTFTNVCSPDAYSFDFNFSPPSFVGATGLDLEPGSDTTFLFGTFNPVGGNAAAGLYTFYNAGFIFQISYTNPAYDPGDPNSQPNLVGDVTIAQTCTGQSAACAFTREVLAAPSAAPEPAAWALMIAGFAGAGAVLRRRRAGGRRGYRVSSQIQLTSQVLPPSAEKACCMCAALGESLNHW